MHYKLTISERAESHIDNILDYVVNVLKNPGAARCYNRSKFKAHSQTGEKFDSPCIHQTTKEGAADPLRP